MANKGSRIEVAVEATTEKLATQLAGAEAQVSASTQRMSRASETTFGKVAKSSAKVAAGVGLITLALSALNGVVKTLDGVFDLFSKDAETAANATQKIVDGLKSIPLVGTIVNVWESLLGTLTGIEDKMKRLQKLQAKMAEDEAKMQQGRGIFTAAKEAVALLNLQIKKLNEKNERKKIEIQLEHDLLAIEQRRAKELEKLASLGFESGTFVNQVNAKFDAQKTIAEGQTRDRLEIYDKEQKDLMDRQRIEDALDDAYMDKDMATQGLGMLKKAMRKEEQYMRQLEPTSSVSTAMGEFVFGDTSQQKIMERINRDMLDIQRKMANGQAQLIIATMKIARLTERLGFF